MKPGMKPGARIADAIDKRAAEGRPALVPFMTAGFPDKQSFRSLLLAIAPHAAAIEVGVPFTDPMADGVTIQRTSRRALENGVTLKWILDEIRDLRAKTDFKTPVILMGYLNPFLSFGFENLARACARPADGGGEGGAGIDALIIPDLPLEEAESGVRELLHQHNLGLVQLVSPVTPLERISRIAAAADGFLYAVTTTGITGSAAQPRFDQITRYLDQVRKACSPAEPRLPICAGFGIRTSEHIQALSRHADGVIVGSALMEEIEAGRDPAEFLRSLTR